MPTASDPNLVIRRVLPVDLRGVAELVTDRLKNQNRTPNPDEVRAVVQNALEGQRVFAVGAYHENQPGFAHGKLVGLLFMHILPSIELPGDVGWIETLYVRQSYRRRGLAKRLLEHALGWAESSGLRAVEVEIDEAHEAEAADPLYRTFGFQLVRRSQMQKQIRP